jgi:hypothetical protein
MMVCCLNAHTFAVIKYNPGKRRIYFIEPGSRTIIRDLANVSDLTCFVSNKFFLSYLVLLPNSPRESGGLNAEWGNGSGFFGQAPDFLGKRDFLGRAEVARSMWSPGNHWHKYDSASKDGKGEDFGRVIRVCS